MSEHDLTGATALVTGASRGLGRGIATALHKAGAQVVGVARDRGPLEDLGAALGGSFTAVLPRITPLTDLGRPVVRAYAARAGQSEEEYLQQLGEPLTPSRPARRSPIWSPAPALTRTPTCSPPQAFARCPDPARSDTTQREEQL